MVGRKGRKGGGSTCAESLDRSTPPRRAPQGTCHATKACQAHKQPKKLLFGPGTPQSASFTYQAALDRQVDHNNQILLGNHSQGLIDTRTRRSNIITKVLQGGIEPWQLAELTGDIRHRAIPIQLGQSGRT